MTDKETIEASLFVVKMLSGDKRDLMRAAFHLCSDMERAGVDVRFGAWPTLWDLCKDYDPTENGGEP